MNLRNEIRFIVRLQVRTKEIKSTERFLISPGRRGKHEVAQDNLKGFRWHEGCNL